MVPHAHLKNEHVVVPKDGLPNPGGSLSSVINSQAISSANRAVEAELAILQKSTAKRKVRALYNW